MSKDIRIGDEVVFRSTAASAGVYGIVEKAGRVNLSRSCDYQLGAVGIGEIIQVHTKMPRAGVDEVWRDGVKVFDSGRAAVRPAH
jgi:hypothetical protein